MKHEHRSVQALYEKNQALAEEKRNQATGATITLRDVVRGESKLFGDEDLRPLAPELDLDGLPDPNQPADPDPYDSNPSLQLCSLADTLSGR